MEYSLTYTKLTDHESDVACQRNEYTDDRMAVERLQWLLFTYVNALIYKKYNIS